MAILILAYIVPQTLNSATTEIKNIEIIKTDLPVRCNEFREIVNQYIWDTEMVLNIALKESGCDKTNHNFKDNHRSWSTGETICFGSWNILNVGCIHYKSGEDIDSVELNVKKAYKIYKDSGDSFRQWSTCKLITGCK